MGYINGSDLLIKIDDGAFGHCTSHTTTYNSETKERAVKPLATVKTLTTGLWKQKGVIGLSVSVSAEGLRFYDETESGYEEIKNKWAGGQSVVVEAYERDSDEPYMSGKFVITSLEETAPAQDDVSYSVSLENDGEVKIDGSKISE